MSEIDFANIYTTSGEVIQLRYAQKRADNGNTIIAMKNSAGAVLIASKPRISKLHVQESDHRIRRIAPNAYMSYSGILSDGLVISNLVKSQVRRYLSVYGDSISEGYLKKLIFDYLYIFTSSVSLRGIGANFLTIVYDNDNYQILMANPVAHITKWKACAVGSGQRRALTELEKLDLESMRIGDMVDEGIKILYKCFDPINDPAFDIEVVYVSNESMNEFTRMDQGLINEIADKYKNISIDDSE